MKEEKQIVLPFHSSIFVKTVIFLIAISLTKGENKMFKPFDEEKRRTWPTEKPLMKVKMEMSYNFVHSLFISEFFDER